MEGMVPGYVFSPTDEQLINEYLLKKKKGLPLPGQAVVQRDLYGEKSPWEVLNGNHLPWQESKTRDSTTGKIKYEYTIYVLTPLKKAGQNRIRRTAGCGRWHLENAGHNILNDRDDVIGFKKMLVFRVDYNYGADEGLIKGHWIMHEYTLTSANCRFALCKITRDASKNVKRAPNKAPKSKAAAVEEEEEEYNQRDGHESNSTFTVPNQFPPVEGAEQSTGAPQSHLATNPSTSSATGNLFGDFAFESSFSELEDPISPNFDVPMDDVWKQVYGD